MLLQTMSPPSFSHRWCNFFIEERSLKPARGGYTSPHCRRPHSQSGPLLLSPLVQSLFKVDGQVEVEVLEHRLEVSRVQGARGAALTVCVWGGRFKCGW